MKFGIGQPVRRVEDARFLKGQGRYVDDWQEEGLLHAVYVRSPVAHARIISVDIDEAARMPGVVAIRTGRDWAEAGFGSIPLRTKLKNRDGSPMFLADRPALPTDRVRYLGEAVAMVVAETRAQAEDAAEAVMVEYDELDVVVDPEEALSNDAPAIHDRPDSNTPANQVFDWSVGDETGIDEALGRAAHVTRLKVVHNRLAPNPMETRGCVAAVGEDGGLALTGAIQGVHTFRDIVCELFGWDKDDLRVYAEDVGGGFGGKNQVQPEHVTCLWMARELGRSVKWISGRGEALLTDSHGRAVVSDVALALDKDGRFLGLDCRSVADLGAYVSTNGVLIPTMATAAVLGGGYDIPSVRLHVLAAHTNTAPTDAYRGAGRPEATYMLERAIDQAAREIGIDRVELRRRNFVRQDQFPYHTALGKDIDTGLFERVLDDALKAADVDAFDRRKAESEGRGLRRGLGVAAYLESVLGPPVENARVGFEEDGSVIVSVGTQSNGQGHETSFAQLAADMLQVDFEKIRFKQSDTAALPVGGGHGGSRSLQIGGTAIMRAAEKTVEKARQLAAHVLEAAPEDIELSDGRFRIAGTDRDVGWEELVTAAYDGRAEAAGLEKGLVEYADYTRENHSFPNGCHIAEVEVDPDTGVVRLERYTVVDDFGRIVNPMLVTGQIMGGVAQGVGQAMLENTVYDEAGQLLTGSFMDYTMPRADDLPDIDITFMEDAPSTTNPLGIKGCGEAGTIGGPPAIVNAVLDALAPYGVTTLDMPLTAEKVWAAIRDARSA